MFEDFKSGGRRENAKNALKIVLLYILFGALWIYFSDKLLHMFDFGDPEKYKILEVAKGWFFIIFTGVALFFLVLKLYGRIFDVKKMQLGERNLWISGFEKINDSVFILGEDLRILLCNKPAIERYGYSIDELKGLKISDLGVASETIAINESIEKIGSYKTALFNSIHKTKDGQEFPVSIVTSKASQFGKIYYVHVATDISEKIKQESLIKKNEELLKKANKTLHTLLKNFQKKVEEEKKIISREIHDQLGQELTAIKMDVSLLNKNIRKTSDPKLRELMEKEINSINTLINRAVNSVRELATKLRPGVLDKLGLAEAIRWLAKDYSSRRELEFDIEINSEDIEIDDDKATNIFRIFQEALTNIVRHSEATKVELKLIKENERLNILIRDNGKGISPAILENRDSIGLYSIEERAKSMDGKLWIESEPGKGTSIEAIIPTN